MGHSPRTAPLLPWSVAKTSINNNCLFLKKTARLAGSLVSAARSVILSFIDYVDDSVSPRCPTIMRNHIFGLVL